MSERVAVLWKQNAAAKCRKLKLRFFPFQIMQALTSSVEPNLDLVEENRIAGKGRNLVIYKQRNVRATRKQILPIIQSASTGCRC